MFKIGSVQLSDCSDWTVYVNSTSNVENEIGRALLLLLAFLEVSLDL